MQGSTATDAGPGPAPDGLRPVVEMHDIAISFPPVKARRRQSCQSALSFSSAVCLLMSLLKLLLPPSASVS